MEKYITKKEMFSILDNAPADVDKVKLLQKYKENGYKIEGYNDQPEPMTGLKEATFQATGNEGIIGGTAKAIGNVPSSAVGLIKSVGTAILNPIDTIKSIGSIIKGTGAKLAETAIEDTTVGQKLLEKQNEKRIQVGMEPFKTDASGKLQVPETPDLQAINAVGKFISDRYGSVDKLRETVIEDPVGVLADLATVISGGAGAISKVGDVSKIAEISNIGSKLSKVSQAIEPINAISKTSSKIGNTIADTTIGRITKDIIPTSTDMQRSQVTKALDLTQGDLANISKKTGNDVTDFIISNDLLKATPEDVAQSLNDFRKAQKDLKASEIAKVTNIYTPEQVPSVMQALDTIIADIDGVAGLEKEVANMRAIRGQKTLSLSDIQDAQYLIDENSNIYSKIGDTKSSSTARGLDKLRNDSKVFIEDEVTKATNGKTNIKDINNKIQTSYSIEDSINTRSTRDLTRQKISLSDSVVLFGGGATFNPAIGVGLYITKKIIESPTFRLKFVQTLNSQPIKTIQKVVTEIKNKNVSLETQKLLNDIASEVMKNKAVIESSSAMLDKSKSETQK